MKSTMFRRTALAALLAAGSMSFASAASAQQAPSAEKQKLVQRALALWHVEDAAVAMAQRPAAEAVQQARIALQGRVPAAKQDSTLKEMAPDVQKFIDEVTPIVRDNAVRLKEPVLGPLLAQNFTEEELKQLIAMLESPVKKKFESLVPQLERAYGEKIAADSRSAVDPKLQAMTQAVGSKLRAASIAH